MRPTLAVPVAKVLIGALSCIAIQRRKAAAEAAQRYAATPAREATPVEQG